VLKAGRLDHFNIGCTPFRITLTGRINVKTIAQAPCPVFVEGMNMIEAGERDIIRQIPVKRLPTR
jgi:hypothetical protein